MSENRLVWPRGSVRRARTVQVREMRPCVDANSAKVEDFTQSDQFTICLNLPAKHTKCVFIQFRLYFIDEN